MNFKNMRKIAAQNGFVFGRSSSRIELYSIEPYSFVLKKNNTERYYTDLNQAEPDIDEIREGGNPL